MVAARVRRNVGARTAKAPGVRRKAARRAEEVGAHAATAPRLLAAAQTELIEGQGQLEMAAVARRAKVSAGLAYHYFGSKAGLIAAVVEAFYDRYDAAVIDLNPLPGGGWTSRERKRLERLIDFLLGEPLAPLVFDRLSAEPEVAAVEARRLARHIALGARNMAGAQGKGEVPASIDPHMRVAMIMGGLRHAAGQFLRQSPPPDRDRLVEELWSFAAMASGVDSAPAATAKT